jgi:alpha-1,2-rhamnosyltransferase
LIPLTHPQFCDSGLVRVFEAWFAGIAQRADGFISISKTISDELQSKIAATLPSGTKPHQWFDYFYLGSDLDRAANDKPIRTDIAQLLQDNRSLYLMVSTIEPRKNHAYLLEAFEVLWAKGLAVQLCFVGRVGWKCATLMRRIQAHTELGRRLFHLHDLSDAELEHCYRRAKALVFPSFVEGFGLPIVEAMQRGLPVMASDIPVFREVGGDFVAYFDVARPASLATLIESFEQTGKFPAARPIDDWRWLNWGEAAHMLVETVQRHIIQ